LLHWLPIGIHPCDAEGAITRLNCRAGGVLPAAWDVEPRGEEWRLRLSWREIGGPSAAPAREPGFGLRLLDRGIRQGRKGTAEVCFAESGFSCRLDLPLASARP
jgi:two-component sensor histidine kinase